MRTFKTRNFARWAKKEKLSDHALNVAVRELGEGLINADLGGGLIKKRIARKGEGKRGGHRVLLAFKETNRSIFLFGFSKNERENLDNEEKEIYKKLAKLYINIPIQTLEKMCEQGQLIEVHHEKN